MKTIVSVFAVLLFALLAGFMIETAAGQGLTSTYRSPNTAATKVSISGMIVGFRAPEWKTLHTSSTEEAEQLIATLNRIGCEVESNNHGDHVDVRFRCEEWRSMKVKTHALQAQWSNWCENQGLETVVVNPNPNTKRPTVSFQMAQPRTVHLHDKDATQKILNTLTLVGCEISTKDHNDHTDATFSCPKWTTIELVSEDSAHAWQKWLKESGFQTKHTHVDENPAQNSNVQSSNSRNSTGSGSASR